MQLKPEEISKIIRAQIKHYENAIEQSETGTVIMVGDGIARASGLEKCMAGELLQFVRYNQAHGILEATATTAVAMTEQQAKSLHEKLEKLTGKTIDLKTKVDPAVLGGIRLDIEGTELDGTVQNRLAALRRDIASVTL